MTAARQPGRLTSRQRRRQRRTRTHWLRRVVTGTRLALLVMVSLCFAAVWSVHRLLGTHGLHRIWWAGAAIVTGTLAVVWAAIGLVQLRRHNRDTGRRWA